MLCLSNLISRQRKFLPSQMFSCINLLLLCWFITLINIYVLKINIKVNRVSLFIRHNKKKHYFLF